MPLPSLSITDAILIAIAVLLLLILYRLNKIGRHVDTIRRIAWKQMFGQAPKD
jgi:hypothetical protein